MRRACSTFQRFFAFSTILFFMSFGLCLAADKNMAWMSLLLGGAGEVGEVVSAGGLIWMDRNLGASQVATSSTDPAAYGDLYQWGRLADGHQIRTSQTITTNSTTDVPVDPEKGKFILEPVYPFDWRTPQNDKLWQGVSGTNNPCPSGFRLPTDAEWETERASWNPNNAAGAFASPLKLVAAGYRDYKNGSSYLVGSNGTYWSSTVSGKSGGRVYFLSTDAGVTSDYRAHGFSVRCLKDYTAIPNIK